MTQDEEPINAEVPVAINNSEVPARPFRITVEFPLFVTMLALSLSGAAISNIILYRTCVHSLGHTKDECIGFLSIDKNNKTHELEKEVQQYATFISTVKSIIESVAPAVLSLFLGVWTDTYGRKPLIVWPLFGIAMTSMLMVVYSMFENLGPWWYLIIVVPYSLTGGFTVLFTGAICYLSDISAKESRSFRITVMEAAVSLGVTLGAILSSYILRAIGGVYLLLVVSTLHVIAYSFTNVYIRESLTGAVQGTLGTVMDLLLVKEMVHECFKRRPNNGRAQILLLTFANCFTILILYGLSSLEYMYSREKLNWTIKDYTLYSASQSMIGFAGAFFGVIIVQKYLRVSDMAFAMVGFVTTCAEYVIKAFAFQSWHMYFGASISVFKGLSSPLIRSFLTKILPVEDIAKVFALTAAVEGICPLVAPVIYNSLYEYTLSFFPGSIYVLSACITGVCAIFLGFVQYFRWTVSTYQPLQIED